MTQHTGELIAKYAQTGDISLVPGIILAMQEEDKVSEVLRFKNCFKALRNIAAHEPSSLVAALQAPENKGYIKIQIKDCNGCMTFLDMTQFAIWMLDMAAQTGIRLYVRFINTLFRCLYRVDANVVNGFLPAGIPQQCTLLQQYFHLQTLWYNNNGRPMLISIKDDYLLGLHKDKPKVFWKIAIPNMLDLLFMLFVNINNFDKSTIKFVLDVAIERDGSVQRA